MGRHVLVIFLLVDLAICWRNGLAAGPTSVPFTTKASRPRQPDPWGAQRPEIMADLKSGDSKQVAAGVAQMRAIAAKTKDHHEKPVNWLVEAKRYDEAESFAADMILQAPDDTNFIATVEKSRAQAFLVQHKYSDALSAARSYYDVAPLKDSSDAINLVAVTLVFGKPDDPTAAKRFKRQQVKWATVDPTTQPAAAASLAAYSTSQPADSLGDPVLPNIPADSKPFETAAQAIEPADYADFVRKGNLLLLAGHAKEAHGVFDRAEAIAPDKEEARAIENVARAIRDESGCVGPANAYILQMRNEQQQ